MKTLTSGLLGGCLLLGLAHDQVNAQSLERVGTRALGMGGAFVAVADDATATWWNPGALPAGPFVDAVLSTSRVDAGDLTSANRQRVTTMAFTALVAGFSVNRLTYTAIDAHPTTGDSSGDRLDRGVEVPVRALRTSQLGVTLVQSVISGVHVGTTLKYVRGSVGAARVVNGELDDLLGRDIERGATQGRFDADVGVLAAAGALRLGLLVTHAAAPTFGSGSESWRMPRQARFGVAFMPPTRVGPLAIAVDTDLTRATSRAGDRRVVAVGAEQWLFDGRVAVRGGARANSAGQRDRAATAGVSVAPRAGVFVEAYGVRGGARDDRGWGVGVRVSY